MQKRESLEPQAARRILWSTDLCRRWGISAVTLWRWQRTGACPPPDFCPPGAQRKGWRLETIEQFERGEGRTVGRE